jgi:hypothetical protein
LNIGELKIKYLLSDLRPFEIRDIISKLLNCLRAGTKAIA